MADDFLKQLYDFVDGSVRYHLESPDNLKDFLTYLAGMRTDVSMRNKLLTYGYNPHATDIRTREAWEKDGFAILDEGAIIYNIQQVPGEKGHYTERVMYDVSSTDMQPPVRFGSVIIRWWITAGLPIIRRKVLSK